MSQLARYIERWSHENAVLSTTRVQVHVPDLRAGSVSPGLLMGIAKNVLFCMLGS